MSGEAGQPAASCPICGKGTISDIAHDVDPSSREPAQRSDSSEMVAYSCGHRVGGAQLDSADDDQLNIERRTSEETVNPGDSA